MSKDPIRNADELADRLSEAARFVAAEHPGLAAADRAEFQSQINEQRYRLATLSPDDRERVATLLDEAQASRDPASYRRFIEFLNDKLG